MLDDFKKINPKTTGLFAAGVLFGTAGIKLLSSRDAKKLYTHVTAAVLRAKECVLKTVTNIQENAEDIYAEAQQINEERAVQYELQSEVIGDEADSEAEENTEVSEE
jgi:exonuclease I